MARYQIAQLNIGRTVAPVDDPRVADFMAWLDDINALAERTPGFVWRLQSESGNAAQHDLRHLNAIADRAAFLERVLDLPPESSLPA